MGMGAALCCSGSLSDSSAAVPSLTHSTWECSKSCQFWLRGGWALGMGATFRCTALACHELIFCCHAMLYVKSPCI